MSNAAERVLTPEARMERAKKLLAEAVADLIVAHLELGSASNEWVDQRTSPLGRRRHCELARTGAIPHTKDGRRVLMRRADVDAYLEAHRVVRVDDGAEEDAEVARLKGLMGRRGAR